MKKVLLLMVAVLMISSVAMADHIGIYADGSGGSCSIAAGFTSGTTVIDKFSTGTTGVRFYIDTSLLVGSVFAFTTPYTTVGSYTNDLSIGLGTCQSGSIVLGTLLLSATGGSMTVKTAIGQTDIIWTDCSFGEHPGTGGNAYVAGSGPCGEIATEPSTWGQVKALYR